MIPVFGKIQICCAFQPYEDLEKLVRSRQPFNLVEI